MVTMANEEICYKPIGVIHTGFNSQVDTPIQSALSNADGTIEVFPEYAAGLKDIEGFSHIFLIYHSTSPEDIRSSRGPF